MKVREYNEGSRRVREYNNEGSRRVGEYNEGSRKVRK